MYIPHSRDRIKVAGREGLFIVMSVDYARERANVRSLARISAVTMHVPFWELLPVDRPYEEVAGFATPSVNG